jgi:hypothetical protein
MTGIQFHEALWTLSLLRREELVAENIMEPDDDSMWAKFAADRVGWAMMNPAQADKLWQAIWRHDPRAKELRGEATVVDLTQRRAAKAR